MLWVVSIQIIFLTIFSLYIILIFGFNISFKCKIWIRIRKKLAWISEGFTIEKRILFFHLLCVICCSELYNSMYVRMYMNFTKRVCDGYYSFPSTLLDNKNSVHLYIVIIACLSTWSVFHDNCFKDLTSVLIAVTYHSHTIEKWYVHVAPLYQENQSDSVQSCCMGTVCYWLL